MLSEIPDSVSSRKTRPTTLLVMIPETRQIYDTPQMAYTTQSHQVSFFAYNEWAETPSQMYHPLIITSLQNTHFFRAVHSPSHSGSSDYILTTQIQQLEQDFTGNAPVMRIVLNAQLSNGLTRKTIATQEFSVSMPIPEKTPYAGVVVANHATAQILRDLTEFVLNQVLPVSVSKNSPFNRE